MNFNKSYWIPTTIYYNLWFMQKEQLDKIKTWFDEYASGFYADDEFVNFHLRLKQDHSLRTCEEMLYLARELSLDANQNNLAEAIGILHDVGRFKQFAEYRTFRDQNSVNHCQLAVEVLQQTDVLDGIEICERQWLEKAIEYHGLKELPKDLNGQCLFFSKLIRDADKIDIFGVAITSYKKNSEKPEGFRLEIELPDVPEYSHEFIGAILHNRRIDYKKLKTWNDMKLLQLAWIYDVNFKPTFRRIKQRKLLETVIDYLPRTEDIAKVKRKVLEFIDSAIA